MAGSGLVMTGDLGLVELLGRLKGADGKAAFRKGCRAAAKLVAAEIKRTAPTLTGALARSTRVRALKRRAGRVGVMVQIYATKQTGKSRGFPYAYAVEKGTKAHPGKRVRRTLQGNVSPRQAAANAAYGALAWHAKPTLFAENAAKRVGLSAVSVAQSTMRTEIEAMRARRK